MTEAGDSGLVERCLAGDLRAFESLVDRYQRVLFNVALHMLANYEDAMDVTQQTFIKAYERLETYDARHKFFSWVYRILVNESLNWIQRRKPTIELSPALASDDPSPEDQHRADRTCQSVRAAIQELPPIYREPLILRHFVDLTYKAIGEAMELPEKTVRSRLFTARRLLRESLLQRGGVEA